MDAITLLKNDHKDVETLFKRFEKAGDRAYTEKREIVDRIIEALSKHAAIEEQLFYPVSRATVDDTEDIVLESMEEHHVVKWLLSELEDMDPRDERFDAKTTVLIENVRHHVEEEEEEFFPKVRDELGRNALNELGDAMDEASKIAPTHPHPRTPDTPPGNIVLGAAAGAVDRVTDTVSGVAQGSMAVLQDVIARVTGAKKRTPSPKGTPTARRAAGRTRAQGAEATDRTVDGGPQGPPHRRGRGRRRPSLRGQHGPAAEQAHDPQAPRHREAHRPQAPRDRQEGDPQGHRRRQEGLDPDPFDGQPGEPHRQGDHQEGHDADPLDGEEGELSHPFDG